MRFLTKNIVDVPLAYEEALLTSRINDTTPDTIWLWRHPAVIYCTNKASINFVDLDYIKELELPIVRSAVFNGANTSVIVAGTDFGLSVYCKNIPLEEMVQKYYVDYWKYICAGLVELEHKGNDLVVAGTDRKISGMVHASTDGVSAGHCMFTETVPNIDFERLYKMPAEKFEDKTVSSVTERITSFQKETGKLIDDAWIISRTIEYFATIGITLEPDADFNATEKQLVSDLSSKHLSEEWLKYGRIYAVPDFI